MRTAVVLIDVGIRIIAMVPSKLPTGTLAATSDDRLCQLARTATQCFDALLAAAATAAAQHNAAGNSAENAKNNKYFRHAVRLVRQVAEDFAERTLASTHK